MRGRLLSLFAGNVVAGAYVLGAGRALGASDDVEPQLLLAGWAGAGGAHGYLTAQPPDGVALSNGCFYSE